MARALGEALTADQVASAVFDRALEMLGAQTVGLWLVGEDGQIRFTAGAGAHAAEQIGEFPPDSDLPGAVAIRTGQVITFAKRSERDARWPALGHIETENLSVVVLPLSARGRRFGAMHIGWKGEGDPLGPGLPVLEALADLCAGALDRARLYDAERRARETLEFLSQGTRIMVSALDPEVIVESLVRLAVPRLAPWCAVYVAEGDQLARAAVEVADAEELAQAVRASGPIPVSAELPIAQVFRRGKPMVIPEVEPADVRGTYDADVAARILALPSAPWTALLVPIEVTGQTIGVMSLLSPDWSGNPPTEVRYAAEGLAGRAGVSLSNAQRYRAQVDSVILLSAALLPEALPEVAGMRFSARYVPAAGGGVCGDWYEVETMPDGHVLVGIGDASGHGVPAAATMAHVRNAARGLAVAGIRPGRMLEHLSNLMMRNRADDIATTIYGLVDPVTGEGTWANAGHPSPLLVAPDGRVTVVTDLPPGPPIGSGGRSYPEHATGIPEGGRLVLYTDGLFERRGEDPDAGITRLVEVVEDVVRTRQGADPTSVDEELAGALVQSRRQTDDDGCVLVIGR